jgi:hypothetical protein
VEEKLAALVTLLEALTVRVKALGQSRTAEDLHRVTRELRGLRIEVARTPSSGRAARVAPHETEETDETAWVPRASSP